MHNARKESILITQEVALTVMLHALHALVLRSNVMVAMLDIFLMKLLVKDVHLVV